MQPGRLAQHLSGQLAGALDQHLAGAPDRLRVERGLIAIERGLKPLQAIVHNLGRDLPGHVGRRGAGARRIFEAERHRIADRVDQAERVGEFGLALLREADDEIARQRDVGPRRAHAVEQAQIAVAPVAAVHRLQHAIVARLHRQMEERHQLFDVAVRVDQPVGHVVGVAGGVADAGEALDPVEFADQRAEVAAIVRPRIDVLAEQRDLARAGIDQRLRLVDQRAPRPADLGAARIGDDAIGAELVAPLLHRQERGRADAAAAGQRAELRQRGHVGVETKLAAPGPRDQIGQVVIRLWSHDDIDAGAARDLLAFGLRDAAGHRDHRVDAVLPQAADVRIDLLGRLFADVAGVEHDEVGCIGVVGGGQALRRHQFAHPLAVIDVHLAAERLDVIGFRGARGLHGAAPIADCAASG